MKIITKKLKRIIRYEEINENTYQIINRFPRWHTFRFIKGTYGEMMVLYWDWYLFLGFWEIKKLHKKGKK